MTRLPPPLFWLALALTVVSLGAAAGPVVWRLAGEDGRVPAPVTPAALAEAARPDIGPILAFAPFGSATVAEAEPQLAGETSLGLTLLGVTIATPASASRAIIAGGTEKVLSYAVGAAVTDTAELAEVYADHVVLKVGDRLETLSFTRQGAAAPAPGAGGTDLRNLIPGSGPAAPAASMEPDAVIARYRAAIQQDAQGVMNRLGLELTEQGYRITDKASPGVRQAGFRRGDVVTTVNGQKVGDMAADQRYFDEVAASGRARVEIQRDGQSIVMSFPLR